MKQLSIFRNIVFLLCITLSTAHASHGDYSEKLSDDEQTSEETTNTNDNGDSVAKQDGDQKEWKEAASKFCMTDIANGLATYRCSTGGSYLSRASCNAACK